MSVWNLNGESSSKKFVNHGGECPDILWLHMLKPCLGSLILHFLPCGDILTYLAEDDFFCVSKNLRLAMCTIVMYYHFFCFSSCILYCSQPFPASCELSNWGSDFLNLSSSPEISRTISRWKFLWLFGFSIFSFHQIHQGSFVTLVFWCILHCLLGLSNVEHLFFWGVDMVCSLRCL